MEWSKNILLNVKKFFSKLRKGKQNEQSREQETKSDDDLPEWLSKMVEDHKGDESDLWIDEGDFFIMSFGFSMIIFSFLFFSDQFEIPDLLFLGATIFSVYFLIVTTTIKPRTILRFFAIGFAFPTAIFLTMLIASSGYDISKINSTLSLVAIGISLIYLPKQKIRERDQYETNKLKNEMLKENYLYMKQQDKLLDKWSELYTVIEDLGKQNEVPVEKIDDLLIDSETLPDVEKT